MNNSSADDTATGNHDKPSTGQENARYARGAVTDKERFLAPDLARGFMLLLIALAHAPFFLLGSEPGVLVRPEPVSVLDKLANFLGLLFVDNRAYPMFAALFGFGMAWLVSRQLDAGTPEPEARRLLKRRAWYLILFGLGHVVIIGGLDILTFYGLSALLIGWLLFRGARSLGRATWLFGVLYVLLMPIVWVSMTADGTASIVEDAAATDPNIAELIFGRLFAFLFTPLSQLFMYPILLAVIVGMWAAKKKMLEKAREKSASMLRLAVIGIAVSIVGGLPLALVGVQAWEPGPTVLGLITALHILTGLAGGFGYTLLFGVIGSRLQATQGTIVKALAALGKRSLTFYLLLEALLVILLSQYGFGLGASLQATGAAIIAILVWLTCLVLAYALELNGKRGPADALLRKLVYRGKSKSVQGNNIQA